MYTIVQLFGAYIIGGLTFLPLLLLGLLIHAYTTFPHVPSTTRGEQRSSNELARTGDTAGVIAHQQDISEKFRGSSRESDVAAGYFAVCREYVPGGVNGKPPERTTPAGDVVPAETPSVYQSVYRSIFDRNKAAVVDINNQTNKGLRRARNIFYVILRHGHLMLYDDIEQLEVRYVISVAHHDVTIFAGGEEIPEGELFVRRNAIALTRREEEKSQTPDTTTSKPFYLFCDNCSEKEDFYYSLLQSSTEGAEELSRGLSPLKFEVADIIKLVQSLHSSEEQLQTRWINALIGRVFLALYKTSLVKEFVKMKINKKISRVKIPTFLSDIAITNIDMGSSAPCITNPRMKDLTVDGECSVEFNLNYAGNFRIEVATTARIDLGTRFKAREVTLVLAVLLKKLEGRGIIRFKPPPSNRVWFTFERMPKLETSIEPVVSSRQITYGVILRAIEAQIREVVAETLVLPNWDDIPFTDTLGQDVRGGIWAAGDNARTEASATEPISNVATVDSEKSSATEAGVAQQLRSREKSMSMPVIKPPKESGISHSRKVSVVKGDDADTAITSGYHSKTGIEKPKSLRSGSFTSSAPSSSPFVSTDTTSVEAQSISSPREKQDATSMMMAISSRSSPSSPTDSPFGSPSGLSKHHRSRGSQSSTSSKETIPTSAAKEDVSYTTTSKPIPITNSTTSPDALRSALLATEQRRIASQARGNPSIDKRQALQTLTSATTAAKKWGLGVLNRANEKRLSSDSPAGSSIGSPDQPMGRGRPLPPPGMPLPFPGDSSKSRISIGASSPSKDTYQSSKSSSAKDQSEQRRRSSARSSLVEGQHKSKEDIFVVAAPPVDSEPSSPSDEKFSVLSSNPRQEQQGSTTSSLKDSDKGSMRDDLLESGRPGSESKTESDISSSWDAAQEEYPRSGSARSEIRQSGS